MRIVASVLLLVGLWRSEVAAQFCINVNAAPPLDLEALIHIGPERAGQIMSLRQQRPFRSLQELTRVNGIGPARIADIIRQGLACTSAPTQRAESSPVVSSSPGSTTDPSLICVLDEVVDGDTFDCEDGRRIRLLLVDTPEADQGAYGSVAKQVLQGLAPVGTPLTIELDVQPRDQYDRLLAYVVLPDGRMVNEELLKAGIAVVAVYPPNVRHVERFRGVAAAAQAGRVGLWAVGAFECLPAEHRAGRCY